MPLRTRVEPVGVSWADVGGRMARRRRTRWERVGRVEGGMVGG